MSAELSAPLEGNLLFHWERPRRRRLAIAGFICASIALHALCFYVFQVVYPPVISLLPPPARVSVIAPTSDEARSFLSWVAAEDPAITSQTRRPADAPAFRLPKLEHIPSYITVPPQLKELPRRPSEPTAPSALPPGPVPVATASAAPPRLFAPSSLSFDGSLGNELVSRPALQFRASVRDAPRGAIFRVGIDAGGAVAYALLEQSSGDPALDQQARQCLTLCRFHLKAATRQALTWTEATFAFGNDLQMPPTSEQAP